MSETSPWDMALAPVACWKAPDGAIRPIDQLSDAVLLDGAHTLWADLPEYHAALAEALLAMGWRSMEVRRVLDRPGRALLPLVAPSWTVLVDEVERRGLTEPLTEAPEPRDLEEIPDVLDQVQRTGTPRAPALLSDILRHRARMGGPVLPWSWVDLYLRMDGLRLGKLVLYPLDHEGWTATHPSGRVFGASRGMLHVLRPTGGCIIVPMNDPAKPPVYEAPDFVSYVQTILTLSLSLRSSEPPPPVPPG